MAHELDITNGTASFANSRSDAWHRLGTSVGHAMTGQEAMEAAHLANWNVRKMALVIPQQPVITHAGVTPPAPIAVPDMFSTCRDNPIVPAQVASPHGAARHTPEAPAALGLAWRYMEAFETEAAALHAAPMDPDEMGAFATTLVKPDDKSASVTARRGRQQQASAIVKLWVSSPTIAPIAGTRWAAYNAVTEYLDHPQPVRGA